MRRGGQVVVVRGVRLAGPQMYNFKGGPKEKFTTTPPANAAETTSFVARKVSVRCTQASLWACEYHSSGLIPTPTRPQAHAQTTGNKRARRASLASRVQLAAKFLATSFVASRATGHGASNAPALGALASSNCTSQRLLSTQHSATSEMIHDLSWSDAQLKSRERPTTPIAGAPWRRAQTMPEHVGAAIERL